MIGYLSGSVIILDSPYIILDVNNVGYKILATSDLLSSIKIGSNMKLFTYTHVKEDALALYGFSKYEDLKLFEALIGISGVGPRTAIGIFSKGDADSIKQAIYDGNVSFFSGIPRLGTKNAQKIIIELKSKIGGGELDINGETGENKSEISNALKAFGFSRDEINDAIKNIDGKKSVEEQIKLALRHLGK